MPSRRRQQFRSAIRQLLAVETLETRAMLAGNVTATVSRGTLVIRGDVSANEIMIQQTSSANGAFTLAPIAGSNTMINSGEVAANFLNVVRFDIQMGGGDDVVGIGNDFEVLADIFESLDGEEEESNLLAARPEENPEEDPEIVITTLFGGDDEFDFEEPDFTPQQLATLPTRVTGLTSLDLGDGDDTLVAMVRSNSNLVVSGGKGGDTILSILSSVANIVVVADPSRGEGMGDDMVGVVLSTVRADLAITTEGGDDGVLIMATSVTNFGVNTGGPTTATLTDDDAVLVAGLYAADHIGIQTEAGDDGIYIDDIVADNLRIVSGLGDDEVEVIGSALVNLQIETSAGEDWVGVGGEEAARPTVIRRNLTINTGADDDQVEIDGGALGMLVGGALDVRTGAGHDELMLYHLAVGRTAVVEMDAGNDSASIDSLDVRSDLSISLSAGNDVLAIRTLSATRYFVRGGTGTDALHDLENHQDNVTASQFESTDNELPVG